MAHRSGRHFLQIPGPTNVPDRVLRAIDGTGAWEAALVNTLSPGDRVLAFETGHFATLWRAMAERLGLEVQWVEGDCVTAPNPSAPRSCSTGCARR